MHDALLSALNICAKVPICPLFLADNKYVPNKRYLPYNTLIVITTITLTAVYLTGKGGLSLETDYNTESASDATDRVTLSPGEVRCHATGDNLNV